MKEGFDREIDSLLRRRARGAAESRLWGDGAGDGSHAAHLDADELSAFSEGALPAAARFAAASHLADCERCRGVVVGLARVESAGIEVKQQTVAAPASTGAPGTNPWRAFVASLFAPRVLRFAVPVLAVSLVAVVSYVALRSGGGAGVQMSGRDAGRSDVVTREAAPPTTATAVNANANAAGLVEPNNNAAPSDTGTQGPPPAPHRGHGSADERPLEVVADSSDAQPSVAVAPPPPAPVAVTAEGPAELSKAAPSPAAGGEAEGARADSRERSEDRAKSARGAEQVEEVASNDAAVQRNRAAQSRANEVQMPDGGTRNQKRGADNNAAQGYGNVAGAGIAAPPKDSERAGSRSEPLTRSRAARAGERRAGEADASRAAETRTAAGRRFRREGNAWVDVNYRPSMPSTGVRRGTEAFRALVADVPEVGRVAEAIGGEVIVVVNGRAYRIR